MTTSPTNGKSKAIDKELLDESDLNAQLFKQLENQKLASLILKNQLQYTLSLKTLNSDSPNSAASSDLLRTISSSPNSSQEKTPLNFSQSPLLTTMTQIQANNNQEQATSFDEIDNEILLENTSKCDSEASAARLKSKKASGRRRDREIQLPNDNGNDDGGFSKVGDSIKTPKSALLERRRRAVHELLLFDRYPSG